ncbi:hypothetical protein E3T25_11375 [Cryobacterium sandaracinum]|uniref:Uncharacterized protein n=1 Tax=Cryobacterium sandaracinum TaxID=1259247 RepID=A0ABY2JC52_9MICO|nr:hypothetical protein [Cryobacterium sandaracinum]TFD01401.1 hypothetical protein E3T25_11375 [Cryobacterium sandaracinum]
MTNSVDAIDGLRTAVESVRARDFENLDQQLVAEILNAQFTFAELRAEGRKQTEQIVTRFVAVNHGMKEASC